MSDESQLARLREEWPAWEFWLVPRAAGGAWWCCRLKNDHKQVLNGHRASELHEYLREREAES